MFYEYECKNEKCSNYERKVTKSCSVDSRDLQECDECNKKLKRVFVATPIRTFGDGYKG